ncbi:ArsR family transcriptional regulator [Brevibacillus centrosporus]|uniref:ArsR/SmtB family transcription factor n=1 Tax=Brevibacillus centrosporus TaxID=54910 RepID=UPI002E20EC73|nr:ArsR family transcriptional regulator [Brevibacillus centrosporus]MED4911471.1 ArsR family transcriptional regulator [Brevibacillus centrosporus]
MTYSVEVSFAPANELITSFYTFLCTKAHKRLELGPNWVKNTTEQLSERFVAELKELEYWSDWGQLQLLVWQCPKKETTTQFLLWLESLSVGELFERLSPWISTFPEDLGVVRDRVSYFLSEWDQQYFQSVSSMIVDPLITDANEKLQWKAARGPVELIELATNGLYFEPVDQAHRVLLIPQYHSQPVTLLHCYRGIAVCQYSSDHLPVIEDNLPSPSLYRLTRSLADKTRLQILHYLKSGPKSYMEIVNHMQMAKSTIYEHTLNLRSAGLIRGHVLGSSVVSYSLREEALDWMNDQLKAYLK